MEEERRFALEVTRESPKSYQVWHHRLWLVRFLKCYSEELWSVSLLLLTGDAKNHSAWVHRQTIFSDFFPGSDNRADELDFELDFLRNVIEMDPFNNSGWSYRAWLMDFVGCDDDDWIRENLFTVRA